LNPQAYVPSQGDLIEQAKYRATPLPPLVNGSRVYGCYADRMRVLKAAAAARAAGLSCCLAESTPGKPASLFGADKGCCTTPVGSTQPCNCS
jgi:hypothetical protein